MFIIKWIVSKIVFKKIRAAFKRKALAATHSATIGVAGAFVALAGFLQTNPEVASALLGGKWGPVLVAVGGVAVAVARARTLGKTLGKED